MSQNSALQSLLEMGCDASLCQAAIRKLKTQNLDVLLDWISEHNGEQQQWKKWLEENKQEKQEKQQQQSQQTITHLVNKEFAQKLQQMGNSKNVSEKSLLFTNNASVESAVAWIEAHKYQADFEDQLFLQGKAFQQSNLTPQEAKVKLEELTKKAREVRKKRQEEQERQRQKNRVRYGKQMVEAKRIAEEQAMKRQVELDRIQKQKDADYKAKLLEQMKRQKNQKLGIKSEESVPTKPGVKKQQKQLNMLEQLELQCEQVKVGMHAYPDRAKTFFETVQIYVGNIIKNNGEQKYRKINKENKAFQGRIAECFGGLETLEVIGYKEDNGFLVMKDYDLGKLTKVSQILGRYKQYY